MKIKNLYAWLFILWAIFTFALSVVSVVDFVDGNLIWGISFLILAVGFSFVSGILLARAVSIFFHNKEVDWLQEIAQEWLEEEFEQLKPFEEFENGK